MNSKQLIQELKSTFSKCLETAKKKNADYAGNEDPFKNFKMSLQVKVSPERAILVRLSDKISRISNLIDRKAKVADEKMEDTIEDAINYLALFKAMLKDKSKNKSKLK